MKFTSLSLLSRATSLLLCAIVLLSLRLAAQDAPKTSVISSLELKKIRVDLEQQAQQSPDKFKQLGDDLLQQSKEQPTDLISLFKWGVFVDESAKSGTLEKNFNLMDVSVALNKAEQPWPIEYQRIKYIISVMASPSEIDVPIGRRLSKDYPEDPEVLYHFGRSLNRIRSPEEGEEQFVIAQKVLKLAPNKSSSHLLFAMYWYGLWAEEKKGSVKRKDFGQKFVDAAKTYLRLVKKPSEQVDIVNIMLEIIEKDIR